MAEKDRRTDEHLTAAYIGQYQREMGRLIWVCERRVARGLTPTRKALDRIEELKEMIAKPQRRERKGAP